MKRLALVFAALVCLGACGASGPNGYVPPSRAAVDAQPVFAPLAFRPKPVVSSRSEVTLF